MSNDRNSENRPFGRGFALILLFGLGAFLAFLVGFLGFRSAAFSLWLSGAAALGFLSGYTTAASTSTTPGNELMKFLSGSVLSLVGGAANFVLSTTRQVTENQFENNLIKKQEVTSTTTTQGPETLAIVGGFLFFFCLFAALGTVVGSHYRKVGQVELMINTKR